MCFYVERILYVAFLLCVIRGSVMAEPECPPSEKRSRADQERVNNIFPGKIQVSTISKQERSYFDIQLAANLPKLTRVKLSLYYVSGNPPTRELTGEVIRRVSNQGTVEAEFLGLKRSIWAGCYRLVVDFSTNQQVPSVLRKLDTSQSSVRREKNWYHGTPAKRERQEKRAMDRARRDFRQFLLLSRRLKRFVRENASSSHPSLYFINPFVDRVHFPLYGMIRLEQWRERFQALKSSNQRRPRFEGRPISFYFMESRTAYFLQTYLRDLEELYNRAREMMWGSLLGRVEADRFFNAYRNLRKQVTKTMNLINLSVPISETQQRQLKQILKQSRSHIENIIKRAGSSDSPLREADRDDIQTRLQRLQSTLFQLDSSTPDRLYRKVVHLSQHLQQLQVQLDTIDRKKLQQELQLANQKLSEVQDRSSRLINQSLDVSGEKK